MRAKLPWIAVALVAAGGCGLVAGLKDTQLDEGGGGAGAGATTTGTTVNSAAATSTGDTATASGGSTGGAGGGGAAGGASGGGGNGGGGNGGGGGGAADPCSNGILDEGEEFVDCGGPACATCGDGRLGTPCVDSGDCRSNLCEALPDTGGRDLVCVGVPLVELVALTDRPVEVGIVVALVHDGSFPQVVGFASPQRRVSVTRRYVGPGWSIPEPAIPLPPGRDRGVMAHDPDGARSWLLAGTAASPELWQWDDAGDTWTGLIGGPDSPKGSRFVGFGYDPTRTELVAHGGGLALGDTIDATRERGLEGTPEWVFLDTPFQARRGHALVYDHDSDTVLAVGGEVVGGEPTATHGFDGDEWRVVGDNALPGRRVGLQAVVDPLRERIVALGGRSPSDEAFGDAWEWIARRWIRTADGGGPEHGGFAVYDPIGHRMFFVEQEPGMGTFEYVAFGTPCEVESDCPEAAAGCFNDVCCKEVCASEEVCNSTATPGVCGPVDPGE